MFKYNLIFYLICTSKMINDNIICSDESTNEICILKSINLKEDFKFKFPIFKTRTTYKIIGKSVIINCIDPCSKIEIKNPFGYLDQIELDLNLSTILGERVIFEFKGNAILENTKISATNKSTKMIKTSLNCISTTGYCFDYDKINKKKMKIPINVREDYIIENFENYIKDKDYKMIKYNLGIGKFNTMNINKGGGQILININELKIKNSILESNFRWPLKELNKKKIKKINKKKNLSSDKLTKTSGTGGVIFIILEKLEIENEKTFAEALGNCFLETEDNYYTSSSSGSILIKADKIMEIKGKEVNTLKIDDLVDKININNYCYSSSTGMMYIKNESKNYLGFIYEKKEINKNFLNIFIKNRKIKKYYLSEGVNENFENKIKFNIPRKIIIIDKIYIKNLSMTLSINVGNKELYIRKFEVDNSKKIILFGPTSNIISFDVLNLKNTTLFKNENFLIKINVVLNLYASDIEVKRIFLKNSDLIMENSKITNFNDLKLLGNTIPIKLEYFQNLEYIIKNIENLRKYYFFTSIDSKTISLINNSEINFAITLLDSKEVHIENSKMKSNFKKKAKAESQNNACGYSGTNNGGLGFFNFKTKNNFCIKSWILKNKKDIYKFQNDINTFSSIPIFISKKDFIKHDVFVPIGGLIKLKGEKIYLEGSIEAKGEDSSNIEKIYIGSTSGGIISLDFDNYEIVEESIIDVSGGKGNYPLGSSGGGKVFLKFKPPVENSEIEKNELKNNIFLSVKNSIYKLFGKLFEKSTSDKIEKIKHRNTNFNLFENKKSLNKISKLKDKKKKSFNTFDLKFFNLGEKSFDTISSYDFPNPIWSFYYENKSIFLGKIYNNYICHPGYFSSLCIKCPSDKFKPFYGFGNCIDCPCEIENSFLNNLSIDATDCHCKKQLFIETYFLEIILIFVIFTCIIIYMFQIIKMTNTENDLIYVLSIEDIANIKYKIVCEGNNIPKNALTVNLSDFYFIDNSLAFCEKFNNICKYNKFEKYLLNLAYFFNFSPSFFLLQSFLKFGKIKKIKNLLKNFVFISKDHTSYNLKYTISKNMNNLSIFFLKQKRKLNSHEFAIKFPYKLPVIGIGLFHYQFKLDLKNPLNVILIKHLKRNINKNYFYDFKNILPKQLLKIKKNAKKIFPFDYFFSYLIILLASLQIKIPFKQFKIRILRLEIFLEKFNIYLLKYGFKITLFMKFKIENQKYIYNFFSLLNTKKNNLKKIIYIFQNNKLFWPHFYFEIQRKKRNEPLSIIFPTIKIKKKESESIININNKNSKLDKKENNLSKILKIPNKNKCISFINKIFNNCFWIFFTYHTCKRKKLPYNLLKILILLILIFFKIYVSQRISFNDYIIMIIIYPPFIDEISIVLVILQVFINKKKLDKFIIYSSFFSFIKSFILTIIFYFFSKDTYEFAVFYFFYSLIFLFLCYFNCYIISFDLFKKTKNIIQSIN